MKINYIYVKKRGKLYTRLKIRVGRRAYCVGQRVGDYWIHSISTDGEVEFRSDHGTEYTVSQVPVKKGTTKQLES